MTLPDPGGNKNAKGRILVVGGGAQTPGAVLLAAEAALRVGAGTLQVATVRTTAPLISTAVPQGVVQGLPERADGDIDPSAADQVVELAASADAVLLGPGISSPERWPRSRSESPGHEAGHAGSMPERHR